MNMVSDIKKKKIEISAKDNLFSFHLNIRPFTFLIVISNKAVFS